MDLLEIRKQKQLCCKGVIQLLQTRIGVGISSLTC